MPYAPERRAILEEFAAPCAAAKADLVLAALERQDGGGYRGTLGLRDARILARLFPAAFGGDPFAKKACLAILFIAGHLAAQGHGGVTADIPIPADCQLPRMFHWAGAIGVSGGFAAALRAGGLLDPASPEVTAFRAAAVVAAHDLGRMAGQPDWMVDGALFGAVRKDPAFQAESLPPMRTRGMWF